MRTTSDLLLAGMVFKIKFLKTMLDVMTSEDVILFTDTVRNIYGKNVEVTDLKNLDMLYDKFRGSDATTIPKTGH
jgi:hypothetical protein